MWIGILIFCGSMAVNTCSLFTLDKGYATEEQCVADILEEGKAAEAAGIIGMGDCRYVKQKGKDV